MNFNISPEERRKSIYAHPKVSFCCICGIPGNACSCLKESFFLFKLAVSVGYIMFNILCCIFDIISVSGIFSLFCQVLFYRNNLLQVLRKNVLWKISQNSKKIPAMKARNFNKKALHYDFSQKFWKKFQTPFWQNISDCFWLEIVGTASNEAVRNGIFNIMLLKKLLQ